MSLIDVRGGGPGRRASRKGKTYMRKRSAIVVVTTAVAALAVASSA
jgi:hypothetical protein